MKRVRWQEYAKDPDRFLVVDVREPEAFRQGSLPGAVNVPLDAIAKKRYELPRGKPLLLVCQLGQKSSLAALYLEADGFEAYVLEGGLGSMPKSSKNRFKAKL